MVFTLAAPRHRMADLARLDELRRLHAEHPRRYFAPLAGALRRSGDPRAAVEVLRPGLAAQPEHLTGHVILGHALADAGDAAGARAAYEQAHRVDEANVVALGALVQLARAAHDDAAAAHWTTLLRDADPEPESARASGDAPGVDLPDAEAPVSAFELLDYDEIAAPTEPPTEPPAIASVGALPNGALDPVVGLDEAPADPLPAAMRAALPELLDQDPEPSDGVAGHELTEIDAAAPPAAPFITETMAGLLAAQGHTAQALEVYGQLLAQRPNDARLLAQVAALRGEMPSAVAADWEDEQAGHMWRAAFAPLADEDAPAAEAVADPVRVAVTHEEQASADASIDDLSFDRFFEAFSDEPASVRPEAAGDFERWADGLEAAPAATDAPVAMAPPDRRGEDVGDDPDADLAAFNRWLRGVDA